MIGLHWYPPILTYHRVHPNPAGDTPTLSPAAFDRQMALLARHWQPVPLATLAGWLERQGGLPPRAVAVTFDDGTEDTATQALPILARYGVPATVFMITENIGRTGFLTRDQLLALRKGGVTIGSHTVRHAYLPSLAPDRMHQELIDSRRQLGDLLGRPPEFLSYPGGGYTPVIAHAAREAGYRAACTTNRGMLRMPIDPWALRRITAHPSATAWPGMALLCSGYYNAFRRLRAPS